MTCENKQILIKLHQMMCTLTFVQLMKLTQMLKLEIVFQMPGQCLSTDGTQICGESPGPEEGQKI